MHRVCRVAAGWLLGMMLSLAPARAEPFQCPHSGGTFVYAAEAAASTLDQMISRAIATRDIAMNIYETLMTRDENNRPIPDLAQAMDEAPGGMTYAFHLRTGIQFHNGKAMTSADVAASFVRYEKVGVERGILANVESWDTPDAGTFIIHMKRPQPTFIETLSAFSAPIVIIPSEQRDVPAGQLVHPVGTGPFAFDGEGDGMVRLRRFEAFRPNTAFQNRTGLGGYKQACFDTVVFKVVSDPAERAAGLRAGTFQAVEDVVPEERDGLRHDKNVALLTMPDWWIQVAVPNVSFPPTDKLLVRQAIQAALDVDEIMASAADRDFRPNPGFQHAGQGAYTDAGKETYNRHDPELAKKLLADADYQGEPVTLLTSEAYPAMYNAALAVQQQLQAIGINARMKVVDWHALVQMAAQTTEGWNLQFTAWGTQPALGPLSVMRFFVQPNAVYKPQGGQDDPDVLAAWTEMNLAPVQAVRQDAFARMQTLVLERVYALPFGSVAKVQGVRTDVDGFVPFRVPRLYNVWFGHPGP
jgi:peptide/nickel transport system substrate-binding protein